MAGMEMRLEADRVMALPERWENAAEQRLGETMLRALALLQADAVRGAPKHSGVGAASIQIDTEGPFPNMTGRVFTPQLHMAVMEFGRRPGQRMPPVEALERWGWLKLRQKGLGFVLARSIARKGIEPRAFFYAAYEKNKDEIIDMFGQDVRLTLGLM